MHTSVGTSVSGLLPSNREQPHPVTRTMRTAKKDHPSVNIRLRLLFFASMAESLGEQAREIEVPAGTTPQGVFHLLAAEQPALARLAEHVSFARNQEFVRGDVELADNDELAFIPPVSGGA